MRRAASLIALALAACGDDTASAPGDATVPAAPSRAALRSGSDGGDGGPDRCARCHPDITRRWRASGHAVAARTASLDILPWTPPVQASAGLGPLPVDLAVRKGVVWCRSADADGQPHEYAITHVIGGRHRQRYLTARAPDGRAWGLPLEFDLRTQRFRPFWAPPAARQPTPIPSDDPRYWHGRQENFSAICFRCHTPLTTFDYDPDTYRYRVDWGRPDEVGVQCTACHGDARAHASAAEAGDPAVSPPVDPLPADDVHTEVGSCGRCHVTGEVLRDGYRPGDDFFDAYQPIVLDDTARFWPDGLRRQEAYTLVSHSLASCFRLGGLRCADCHDPHGDAGRDDVRRRSHAACNRCHEQLTTSCTSHAKFPVATTPGCTDCHMQRIPTEGSAREMHDHRILAPDPTLTLRLGVPNACASCHADAGPAWAVRQLAAWGAKERPRRRWAIDLAAALQGDRAAAPALIRMLRDAAVPWPIAATAGRLLGRFPSPEAADALRDALLHGRHPMIRSGAAYGLVGQPGDAAVAALREALDEPTRAAQVMIASALIVRGDAASRDAAVAVIRAVLDEIPDDVALRRLLAYAWEQAGDHGQALAELARARAASPYDAALRDAEARCRKAAEARR